MDAKRDLTQNNYCRITTKRYSTYDVGSLLVAFLQACASWRADKVLATAGAGPVLLWISSCPEGRIEVLGRVRSPSQIYPRTQMANASLVIAAEEASDDWEEMAQTVENAKAAAIRFCF